MYKSDNINFATILILKFTLRLTAHVLLSPTDQNIQRQALSNGGKY